MNIVVIKQRQIDSSVITDVIYLYVNIHIEIKIYNEQAILKGKFDKKVSYYKV